MISNSRHPQTLVKVQSFKALNKSIDKLGSDISGLLPDIVPFIGEGLEDDNEMVNNESKAAMRKLEVVCKTDLKEYFT